MNLNKELSMNVAEIIRFKLGCNVGTFLQQEKAPKVRKIGYGRTIRSHFAYKWWLRQPKEKQQ